VNKTLRLSGRSLRQAASRGPNRTRFLAVQTTLRVKMQCNKKSLFVPADTSEKHNLMTVGGYVDNVVDLCEKLGVVHCNRS
jgi:hypothetical protein